MSALPSRSLYICVFQNEFLRLKYLKSNLVIRPSICAHISVLIDNGSIAINNRIDL